MSEHEIAKHTKAIYTEWRNPAHGWKHKLGEILTEIFIIVFAITLSLLVERWRENAHERTLEKQFLIGLKKDLQGDLIQLKNDSTTYAFVNHGWTYYYNAGKHDRLPDTDSLTFYQRTLFNNTSFFPNNSRFEALKSSGGFGVIEDDSLQNMILDLYQNKIPLLHLSADLFNKVKNDQLDPFLFVNLRKNSDTTSNLTDLIRQPLFQNYMSYRFSTDEISERYHRLITQSQTIIEMIDEQYDLKND